MVKGKKLILITLEAIPQVRTIILLTSDLNSKIGCFCVFLPACFCHILDINHGNLGRMDQEQTHFHRTDIFLLYRLSFDYTSGI